MVVLMFGLGLGEAQPDEAVIGAMAMARLKSSIAWG